MSGVTSGVFSASLSGLQAHGVIQQVVAHNVANVSTDGFEPRHAVLAEKSGLGGTQLQAVLTEHGAHGTARETLGGRDSAAWPAGEWAVAGTDLAREFTGMISGQHAFSANAQVVRTQDEMLGTLLDIRS